MSLEFVRGDMFATPGITMIAHGVNLQGAFAAGVAGAIAQRFPWAKMDYEVWLNIHRPRLGDVRWSYGPKSDFVILHLATQLNPGRDARLDAVATALLSVRNDHIRDEDVIAFPQIGCGIGGLEWRDVKPYFSTLFETAPFRVLVFEEFVKDLAATPMPPTYAQRLGARLSPVRRADGSSPLQTG